MTTGRCIFQGEIGEILLPDLLTFLDMLGKTGTLELRRPDDVKRIYWDRGEIVFAESSIPGERIGESLARNGWITPEALEEARAATAGDDNALVRHVLGKGEVQPELLPRAIKSLVLEIVYSLFEWKDGAFRFLLTPEPHSEKVILKTSVSNIIMEGSRRLDEWKRIRAAFESDEVYPVRAAGEAATVKLPPLEHEVLAFVDGRRDIAAIVGLVDHDQFTVLNALLTLHSVGLITISREPVETSAAAAGRLPDAQASAARGVVAAFANIFAGIHARIAAVKGPAGIERFTATLRKSSFQKAGPLAGVEFLPDGRLPVDAVLANLEALPEAERLATLKSTLDRLLAQQVVQLDTSYPADEKKAISELIAREKSRIVAA